jgi:small-conductance mechanosensitive channel
MEKETLAKKKKLEKETICTVFTPTHFLSRSQCYTFDLSYILVILYYIISIYIVLGYLPVDHMLAMQ